MLKDLHEQLVQTVIAFYKEHKLPEDAYRLTFSIEDIQSSLRYSNWHASSDSCCVLENLTDEIIEESL